MRAHSSEGTGNAMETWQEVLKKNSIASLEALADLMEEGLA